MTIREMEEIMEHIKDLMKEGKEPEMDIMTSSGSVYHADFRSVQGCADAYFDTEPFAREQYPLWIFEDNAILYISLGKIEAIRVINNGVQS